MMNKYHIVSCFAVGTVIVFLLSYVDDAKADREYLYNFTTSKRVVRQVKHKITKANIKDGKIILVRAFRTSMSFVYLVTSVTNRRSLVMYLPTEAKFYTRSYRNIVRHLSLIPDWLTGKISYINTHQLIPLVYRYNDVHLPTFVKKMLFWVSQKSWDDELREEDMLEGERRLLTQPDKYNYTVPFRNLTWVLSD